jgi:hypothetical protein
MNNDVDAGSINLRPVKVEQTHQHQLQIQNTES